MPENLRITAPVPNNEGVLKPNLPPESPLVEAVDPSRVNRPNPQEQNRNAESMDLLLRRDSVFGRYVQQLRQTPALSETLGKALAAVFRPGGKSAAGPLPEGLPLAQLAAGVPAEKGDMVDGLRFQQKDSTLFSGPLFQLLGRMEERGDAQFALRLASFLKAFDGYVSIPDTTGAILLNLGTIGRQIPAPYAKKLAELAGRLDAGAPEGSIGANLKLLKAEILPLLSDYVAKSSDYGAMRETLSLLLHNTSLLNVSTRGYLDGQFEQLAADCRRSFGEPMTRLLRSFYLDAADGDRDKPQNRFLRSLVSLLSQEGGAGADGAVRGDILRSVLLDNSAFMPFLHFYLPVVWQGRFLFSEIWVEKKDGGEAESAPRRAEAPTRLYLSFDIQDLGAFEARVELAGKKADLSLSCPGALMPRKREISDALGRILAQNGLQAGEVRLKRGGRPEIPGIVLKKVMERKRAVDVTV